MTPERARDIAEDVKWWQKESGASGTTIVLAAADLLALIREAEPVPQDEWPSDSKVAVMLPRAVWEALTNPAEQVVSDRFREYPDEQ